MIVIPGRSIGPFRLGDHSSEVIERLGQPSYEGWRTCVVKDIFVFEFVNESKLGWETIYQEK